MHALFVWNVPRVVGSIMLAGGLALCLHLLGGCQSSRAVGKAKPAVADGVADLTGHARVVDGDTIDVAGVRVRLEGIDAPETGQRCPGRSQGTWPAGRKATSALKSMINGQVVSCRSLGYGKYGRMLGACRTGSVDLNAEMVRRGHAWAFVKYSRAYVDEERVAQARGAGIWQSKCRPAWAYRAGRWSAEVSQAPNGCAIKGNITRNGRIYHLPWSPWYAKTKIEPHKGERWFCDESEAKRAGWRPARPQG